MRYFIFKKRYLLILITVFFYLFFAITNAFASGGDPNATWQPLYDASPPTGNADTFGVWVCTIASKITFWMPSTPPGLWLSSLSSEIGSNIPFVGTGIFYSVISDIRNVLILVASFKVFKSLSRF